MAAKKKTSSPEKQALIMWALLVKENAGAFQKGLKPEPDKADRDALEERGLISWWKVGQKIWIEVTDKGWAWAGENLSASLPAKSTAGTEILREWLAKLQGFIEARGLVLADVLGPLTRDPRTGGNGHLTVDSPSSSLHERSTQERARTRRPTPSC